MKIQNITVLGSGIMGRGIAHVCALGGFEVGLYDLNMEILLKAKGIIGKNLARGVELGKVKPENKDEALARITLSDNFPESVANADLVIEAVPEDLDLKLKIFKELDQLCPPHTIFATNTSAKSITEIASATRRPEKVIGLHFFNPVHLMKLVEIIKGLETSEDTYILSDD